MNSNRMKIGVISSILVLITIIFFTYSPIITFDSSHYLWLTNMLSPNDTFCNWDIARGLTFPFFIYVLNVFFGNGPSALLIGMYSFYIVMLIFTAFIFNDTVKKEDKKSKILIAIIFMALVALNPIIFGYYHTLLTEFMSITIAICTCYLAWKFIDLDILTERKKYILLTVFFAIVSPIVWHLKQPYIGTVIYPLITALVISIIKYRNKKNILYKCLTVFVSLVMIAISIVAWDKLLKLKNVKADEGRSSSSYLTKMLIEGVSNYNREFHGDAYTRESIEANNRISIEDKQKIYDILDKKSEYKNFIILRATNDVDDYKIIYTKENDVSTVEAAKFILSTLVHRPWFLLEGYISSYLATIDIFQVEFEFDTTKIILIKKFDLLYSTENSPIAYRVYNTNSSNLLGVIDYYMPYAGSYETTIKPVKLVNFVFQKLENISTIIFKFTLLLLPFLFVEAVILRIKLRGKYNDKYIRSFELVIVLYSFSLLHVLSHAMLGAILDRYAVASYTTNIVAMILNIYLLANIKANRVNKTLKKGEN